jgi:hypothetical protein
VPDKTFERIHRLNLEADQTMKQRAFKNRLSERLLIKEVRMVF